MSVASETSEANNPNTNENPTKTFGLGVAKHKPRVLLGLRIEVKRFGRTSTSFRFYLTAQAGNFPVKAKTSREDRGRSSQNLQSRQ